MLHDLIIGYLRHARKWVSGTECERQSEKWHVRPGTIGRQLRYLASKKGGYQIDRTLKEITKEYYFKGKKCYKRLKVAVYKF